MVIFDKESLVIDFYTELISLADHLIKIKINTDFLYIHGQSLFIDYFDNYEIKIKGTIRQISYENRL